MFMSVGEIKRSMQAYGLDLSFMEDSELAHIAQDACAFIDAVAASQLTYRRIENEMHIIPRDNLVIDLFEQPIRTLLYLEVFLGATGGQRQTLSVVTTPVEAPSSLDPQITTTPVVYGDAFVDRSNNLVTVQIVYPNLSTYQFASFAGYRANATYTTGYDDGTVQADGMSLPAPPWLQLALKLTLRRLFQMVAAEAGGLNEAVSNKIGQIVQTVTANGVFDVPAQAREILEDRHAAYGMA